MPPRRPRRTPAATAPPGEAPAASRRRPGRGRGARRTSRRGRRGGRRARAEPVAPVRPPASGTGSARPAPWSSGYFGSVRVPHRIDDETWDELEEALIRADVGVHATTSVLDELRARVKAEKINDPDVLLDALKAELNERLDGADRTLHFDDRRAQRVAVRRRQRRRQDHDHRQARPRSRSPTGRRVVMAAGDTFRAAAAEQLELWAERAGAELVRGDEGGDPASVDLRRHPAAPRPAAPTWSWPTPPAASTPRSTSWRS